MAVAGKVSPETSSDLKQKTPMHVANFNISKSSPQSNELINNNSLNGFDALLMGEYNMQLTDKQYMNMTPLQAHHQVFQNMKVTEFADNKEEHEQ